jgi:flagellar biosynthesis protein FlhG
MRFPWGKTWLAITLAQAMAAAGQRVLLLDADLGLANVDVQLGLAARLSLADVLAGRPLAEATVAHPAGFEILPGHSGSGALAGLEGPGVERLLGLAGAAAAGRDAVLLDLGAGLAAPVRRLAAAADTLLVVATEEPTSLTDAYAVLKLHRRDRPGGDARVVVNQASGMAAGERVWRSLDRACAGFLGAGVPLAGIIRRDAKVPEAIRRQAPLLTRHPNSTAARDVAALAAGLRIAAGGGSMI